MQSPNRCIFKKLLSEASIHLLTVSSTLPCTYLKVFAFLGVLRCSGCPLSCGSSLRNDHTPQRWTAKCLPVIPPLTVASLSRGCHLTPNKSVIVCFFFSPGNLGLGQRDSSLSPGPSPESQRKFLLYKIRKHRKVLE